MIMIHWEETIDDALAFYQYYVKTDAEVRRMIRIRQFLGPPLVWVVLAIIIDELNVMLVMAAIVLVWMALTPAWERSKMVEKARKAYLKPENFRNLGVREMMFSNEGFLLKTSMCETLYKWKVVTKVVRVPDYCFIDIGEQEMLIVPERQLTDEGITELNHALETYVKVDYLR